MKMLREIGVATTPGADFDAERGHRFNAKACEESFDAKVWDSKPFDSKFDAARVLACTD